MTDHYFDQKLAEDVFMMEADLRIQQEIVVLKSILWSWDEVWECIEKFCTIEPQANIFRRTRHQALWRAMRRARVEGVSGHSEDLVRFFVRDKEIRKAYEGLWKQHEQEFLKHLHTIYSSDLPTITSPVSVPAYLDAMSKARQREQIRSLARGVAKGDDVSALQKALDGFSDGSGVKGGPSLMKGARGLTAALTGWKDDANPDPQAGIRIPWHIFPRFDHGGAFIRDGDYAIMAARPSRGKTTAAIQIACNTAARFERPVLYVSLEMPARQVWQKAVLAEAGVDDPQGREFDRADLDKVMQAKAYLEERVPLLVLDQPPANLWRLKSYLSSVVQNERPVLTVIDYLGLIQAKGDEYQRITLISQHLRGWALGNTPILMLHQLNRGNVSEGKRARTPRQADLRGSGQIEQDATHIVFLHEAGGLDDPKYDYEQDSNPTVPLLALLSKARQGQPGRGERMLFHRAQSRMLPRA